MTILIINGLESCPKCECSKHKVYSEQGSENCLYSGDVVECGNCGHKGVIDTDDGVAWVDWFKVQGDQDE